GRVTEVAPTVDHLLRRSTADAELKPAARDQVGGTRIFDHVERVLVAHVDDGRADLDLLRARTHRGEQGERRAELAREVVHPEVRAVGAELLRGFGELDRLDERVRARTHLRVRRRRPVPEREETDLL